MELSRYVTIPELGERGLHEVAETYAENARVCYVSSCRYSYSQLVSDNLEFRSPHAEYGKVACIAVAILVRI